MLKIRKKIHNIMNKKKGFVIQSVNDSLYQRKNFKSTNKKKSLINYLLMLFLIIFPLAAFILAETFPHLVLRDYLFNHIFYIFVALLLLIYFLIARFNYYILRIDAYIIDIKIFQAVMGIYNLIDHVDISHEMFIDFSFSNRPFLFSKILTLKIKTSEGKSIKKNLNLLFLSKKEEHRIGKLLKKIITKNNLGNEEVFSNKF